MIKYEVRTVEVETKNGYNAFGTFNESTNQTTEFIKAFDTLDEAKAFYATIKTDCRRMDGLAMPYYLHSCKLLEINEYDKDGEWVGGGDWQYCDFPDRTDDISENSEDDYE